MRKSLILANLKFNKLMKYFFSNKNVLNAMAYLWTKYLCLGVACLFSKKNDKRKQREKESEYEVWVCEREKERDVMCAE